MENKFTSDQLMNELEQARDTIVFMHGCLTSDGYKYAYPEQTLEFLDRLDKIIPKRNLCLHSIVQKDCKSCADLPVRLRLHYEVDEKIGLGSWEEQVQKKEESRKRKHAS